MHFDEPIENIKLSYYNICFDNGLGSMQALEILETDLVLSFFAVCIGFILVAIQNLVLGASNKALLFNITFTIHFYNEMLYTTTRAILFVH